MNGNAIETSPHYPMARMAPALMATGVVEAPYDQAIDEIRRADLEAQREPTTRLLDPLLGLDLRALALADRLAPELGLADPLAAAAWDRLGASLRVTWSERALAIALLHRRYQIRLLARSFFARHPGALGVHLGGSYADEAHWQRLRGERWLALVDPEVAAIRARIDARKADRACSEAMNAAGWWLRQALPTDRPVLCVAGLDHPGRDGPRLACWLEELGAHAAPGSELLLSASAAPSSRGWLHLHPRLGFASEHPLPRPPRWTAVWPHRRIGDLVAPTLVVRLLFGRSGPADPRPDAARAGTARSGSPVEPGSRSRR